MPTRERVQKLIDFVESGRTEDALKEFYTDDVEMSENLNPATKGKSANIKRERDFLAQVKEIHEYRATSFIAAGDRSAIHWILDVTNNQGQRLRLDEVAWQSWRGDRIFQERFIYDPNTVLVSSGTSVQQ
jgi:ketosteroid isomerase-like protein